MGVRQAITVLTDQCFTHLVPYIQRYLPIRYKSMLMTNTIAPSITTIYRFVHHRHMEWYLHHYNK